MFSYEINSACHNVRVGREVHFARMHLTKGITEEMAKADFAVVCKRFPAREGFSLTLYKTPAQEFHAVAYSEGA